MNLNISPAGGGVEVPDEVFAREFNEGLVHQVVVAYLAGGRQGSKAQKTRSEVRGGGRKPWRQKGTGRARAGTIRSPIWRGGGRAFAAKPRDHAQKVNRKMYRAAVRCILSELVRQERMVVVSELAVEAPKTRQLLASLAELGLNDTRLLIITAELDANLELAARNVPEIEVRTAARVDPVALVGAEKVLITVAALEALSEGLA